MGLRLRMNLTAVPELAILPWEFLYEPERRRFLTLYTETPLVRYLELSEPDDYRPVKPPFKILVAIACPARYVQLDAAREFQELKDALVELETKRLIQVELLDDATGPGLQQRLRQEDYHVFHFIGHGDVDRESGEGFLIMEDETHLTMNGLGVLLKEELHTLRLVILNACKGARSSPGDPFNGLAQRLIQEGIPAVIAMQFAISDPAAIDFAGEFYRSLADGVPVDSALAWARKAIYLKGNKLEWGTPVLFLRSENGQIFQLEEGPQSVNGDLALPPDEPADESPVHRRPPPEYVECFVDREKQFQRFLEMIGGEARQQVMFIEAPAEMGKTWLIERLRHECLEQDLPVARIDFEVRTWSHVDVVLETRSQLGQDHFPQVTAVIERHPGLALSTPGDLDSLQVPHSDSAREFLERQLMDAFVKDLRVLSRGRVVVLLFDSYEEAPRMARRWLRGDLLADIRDARLPNIIVVLAGRRVPGLRSSWRVHVARTGLACFEEEHVVEYLRLKGISRRIQPPTSALCIEGSFVPGELATEIATEKGEWL
jgi:hypothetical protein